MMCSPSCKTNVTCDSLRHKYSRLHVYSLESRIFVTSLKREVGHLILMRCCLIDSLTDYTLHSSKKLLESFVVTVEAVQSFAAVVVFGGCCHRAVVGHRISITFCVELHVPYEIIRTNLCRS